MNHEADVLRRRRLAEINAKPGGRAVLEAMYGLVRNSNELAQDFRVQGFLAPFVVVVRKRDGQRGSLEFQHHERYYFNFVADAG